MTLNAPDIYLERVFDAPVARVWHALTDVAAMKQWYFDLPDFRAEAGAEFRFSGGPSPEKQYTHICEVTEVIPQKKISYSWRYDGYTGNSLVCFELKAQGEKTVVVFTHTGLASFPKGNPDLAPQNFAEGWNHIINIALKDYLEKIP